MSLKLIQVKAPDYTIVERQKIDDQGNPMFDQFGHAIMEKDYSAFPDITRKCPCCGAVYKTKLPELIDSDQQGSISLNGSGVLGFRCPNCGMPIAIYGNTDYMIENPPMDDSQS